MKKIILIMLAVLMLAVCTLTADDYPQSVQVSFMDGCTGAGSVYSNCVCMLQEMQDTYTLKEFYALEKRMELKILTDEDAANLVRIAQLCVDK